MITQDREQLEARLLDIQKGLCFICEEQIDSELQELDIDHVVPRARGGRDVPNNYALAHASCNRSKGASDLRVARALVKFNRLRTEAIASGKRGANLGDILKHHGGGAMKLRLRCQDAKAEFSFSEIGQNAIQETSVFRDKLSETQAFFTSLPLAYLHHDDRINPRDIGPNLRGLIEEFLEGNPQLHIALAWWADEGDGAGTVKVFDGQHKAAAQILLGVRELPVRVFVNPDTDVLLRANTNAGSKLRQVAFDKATMRHLGSSLYHEREQKYRQALSLEDDDDSFSEQDLVRFFRGASREMERYIVDAQRDSITYSPDNRLLEFVEWSGKGASRPLAYSSIESSFFKELLHQKALTEPLAQSSDCRLREKDQLIRIMSMFATVFFVDKWGPDLSGWRIETRVASGESIPPEHLRAWRIARAEVLANVVRRLRDVIEHHYAFTAQWLNKERLLHNDLPDPLWEQMRNFLENLAEFQCWTNPDLSNTVFGPKQNLNFWQEVFRTGTAPTKQQILAEGIDLQQMIQPPRV